jgi:Fe-S-cluster containining protein
MLTDETLLRIVDQALARTAARSGDWLVCKPGCSQCCHGAFAINRLDAIRLQAGLKELRQLDPARARRVEERSSTYVAETCSHFPGDARTGALGRDQASQVAFEAFENERACPVLDPATQTCDLYGARPMTCRVFGPPVRNQEGLGLCELCYTGATEQEIAACEMVPDPDDLEGRLMAGFDDPHARNADGAFDTIVGYAITCAQMEEVMP